MDARHFNKSFRLKTEKAIEIINIYENTHSQVAKLSLILGSSIMPLPAPRQSKPIDEGKWHKMQFLPQQSKVTPLGLNRTLNHERCLLKLIFRQFSGKQILFAISNKQQIVSKEECAFTVRNQKIMRIPVSFTMQKELFITFHSGQLVFFRFKFELANEGSEKQLPQRALSEERRSFYNLPRIDSQPRYGEAKTQRSNASLETRSRQKSPRIQTFQEAVRGRLQSISHQKLKFAQAQGKKQDLHTFHEKSRQLREVSRRCRGLLDDYEQFCKEHSKKVERVYRSTAILVFLSKFVFTVSSMAKEHSAKLKDAAHLRTVVRKYAARFIKISRQLKMIAPPPIERELVTVRSLVQLEAKCIYAESRKKAGRILMDCLVRVGSAALVNKALVKSSDFRVKIRAIQKYWQERNHAQLASFEEYINHQIKDLLAKHPHFAASYNHFYENKTGRALSWQYLKEISLKLKSIFGGYYARLTQIQEMHQANELIKAFNMKALKKHQKQELQIPKAPSYPVTRYFRDISQLKSMTRTWFEIQYRKIMKNVQQKKGKSTSKGNNGKK